MKKRISTAAVLGGLLLSMATVVRADSEYSPAATSRSSISPALASASTYFNTGGPADWNTSGSWNNGIPTITLNAYIGGSGGYTATYTTSVTGNAYDLYLGIASNSGPNPTHLTGAGTLNMSAGTLTTGSETFIGYATTGTGTVNLSGGTLNSPTTAVGDGSNGALYITGSGYLNSKTRIYCGLASTGTGTLNVTGPSASLNAGTALVGDIGQGFMNITNGGSANIGTLDIGSSKGASPSTVLIDGSSGPSTLNCTNTITVGQSTLAATLTIANGATITGGPTIYVGGYENAGGIGTMNILNGSSVTGISSGAYIGGGGGSFYAGTGTVNVDGSGSTWNLGIPPAGNIGTALVVGYGGTGTLNITNGASVVTPSTPTTNGEDGSYGTFLYAGSNGTAHLNFGSTNGGTLTTCAFVGSPGQIGGSGTINAYGGIVTDANITISNAAATTSFMMTSSNGGTVNVTVGPVTGYPSDGAPANTFVTLGAGYLGTGTLTLNNNQPNAIYNPGENSADNWTFVAGAYSGSNGTVNVDGSSTSLAIEGQYNYIGYSGAGRLNITNGALVSFPNATNISYNALYMGYNSGSSGTLFVGSGSTLVTGLALVGGTSNLDGGVPGGTGTATVDGSGSIWYVQGVSGWQQNLCVGASGVGTLNITNGATVDTTTAAASFTLVGYLGGTGNINFANGGTLKTVALYASPSQLSGSGTINANGLVTDGNVTINPTTAAGQTIPLVNSAGTITLNLTPVTTSFSTNYYAALGAGYTSSGTLTINGGVNVYIGDGYPLRGGNGAGSVLFGGTNVIGYLAGSNGTMNVDGSLTTVTAQDGTVVGYNGKGTLNITNGAQLNSYVGTTTTYSYIGYGSGGSGTANIAGSGSEWNNYILGLGMGVVGGTEGFGPSPGIMRVTSGGQVNTYAFAEINSAGSAVQVDGTGSAWSISPGGGKYNPNLGISTAGVGGLLLQSGAALYISGGGMVTAGVSNSAGSTIYPLYIDSTSLVEIEAGSTLAAVNNSTNSNPTYIYNGHIIRLVAGADAAVSNSPGYAPISCAGGFYAGDGGIVQGVGGVWSGSNFLTYAATTSAAGSSLTLNTGNTANLRSLWTDTSTGNTLGASLLYNSSAFPPTYTLTATAIGSPQVISGPAYNQIAEEQWQLSGIAASSTNPVYLSLSGFTNPIFTNYTVWYSSNGGTSWAQVTSANAADLTFDGTDYSFALTASGGTPLQFGGYDYAVVGTPALAGDINLDGRVDINDLTLVLANYGQTGQTWTQGAIDGDPTGTVDINDLTIVLDNYGATVAASGGPGIHAVPEPASLLLLAAALGGLLAYAWRKGRCGR